MYKQFHKKEEEKETKVEPLASSPESLEKLAQLIAISLNSDQLIMCISSIIQSE